MTYEPNPVIQADGSRHQWENCTCAESATALDRDTKGSHTTNAAAVRWATGDTVGGTNLDQCDYALRRLFPPDDHLDCRRMLPFDDMCEEVAQGRGAVVQGGYGPIAGTSLDGSPGFTGNHAWYCNEVWLDFYPSGRINFQDSAARIFDCLWDARRPGIPSRQFRWVELSIVRAFCADLLIDTNRRVGLGYCYAGFTRDTEPSDPKPVVVPIDFGSNGMIVSGGLVLTSSHTMALPKGYALRKSPASAAPAVAHMARAARVPYMGKAAAGWNAVLVKTANFPDAKLRPVVVYVPAGAGHVAEK